MSLIYGVYKDVRNAAWRCLIDFEISELPVRPSWIAKAAGIKVIKNSDIHELSMHESGASILVDKKWYIIYDDKNPKQRSRFTIAHELGHIFLGHELRKGYYARTFNTSRPVIEQQADAFAARLLAPACVLWGLELHSAEDISKVCDISMSAAAIRAERMEVLYSRNKFLSSPLERKVYNNFKEYIKKQKAE